MLGFTPFENADGRKKGVGAVLVEGDASGSIKFGQAAGVFGLFQAGAQASVFEFVAQVVVERVGALLFGVSDGIPRIVLAHQLRFGLERKFALGGQLILHMFRRRREDANGGLGFLKIQQPIA